MLLFREKVVSLQIKLMSLFLRGSEFIMGKPFKKGELKNFRRQFDGLSGRM